MYECKSILFALDLLFKTFLSLSLDYPFAPKCILLFMQRYFFKITSPDDDRFVSVVNLLTELQIE
jgi:hypothetical protein